MASNLPKGPVANWNPGNGGVDPDSKRAKLFSTEAHDAKDTMTGTNELKEYIPKGGKPKGPLGVRGHGF